MNPAIVAEKEIMQRLVSELEKTNGNKMTEDVTQLYKTRAQRGLTGVITDHAKSGKEVLLLLTCPEVEKASYMEHGWGSINGLTQHIDKVVEITSRNIRKKAKEFKELILSGK